MARSYALLLCTAVLISSAFLGAAAEDNSLKAGDEIGLKAGRKLQQINVPFPGGSTTVVPGQSTAVTYPGGTVNVNRGQSTDVTFPGGSVGVVPGQTSVNTPWYSNIFHYG